MSDPAPDLWAKAPLLPTAAAWTGHHWELALESLGGSGHGVLDLPPQSHCAEGLGKELPRASWSFGRSCLWFQQLSAASAASGVASAGCEL